MGLKHFFLTTALLVAGCLHIKNPKISEYKLSKFGPFIISEFPELQKRFNRNVPAHESSVEFLVKNSAATPKTLLLRKATLDINGEKTPLTCKQIFQGDVDLPIAAQEMTRIHCDLKIQPTLANELGQKDSIVKIEIPSDAGTTIVIERLFHVEEFQ